MREMFTMWRHTNMVVLTALSAAIYAALLIPFQSIPIIPGHVSLRVADIVPMALALLFGPAGAWGSAIGNLIGDFFGTLSPGAIGGFVSQLFAGLITYKLWGALGQRRKDYAIDVNSGHRLTRFVAIAVTKSLWQPLMLTFWVALVLRLVPAKPYSVAVIASGLVMSLIGGPIILRILAPRIKKWGLLWTEIMEPEEVSKGFYPKVGIVLVVGGSALGAATLYFMLFLSGLPLTDPLVRFSPLIFIVAVIVGVCMLGGRNQVEAARRADLEQERSLTPPRTSG
jgi:energy-coupling factor transport system substrate-specific component